MIWGSDMDRGWIPNPPSICWAFPRCARFFGEKFPKISPPPKDGKAKSNPKILGICEAHASRGCFIRDCCQYLPVHIPHLYPSVTKKNEWEYVQNYLKSSGFHVVPSPYCNRESQESKLFQKAPYDAFLQHQKPYRKFDKSPRNG